MSERHEERMRILDDLNQIGVDQIRALARRAQTATRDELIELATEFARVTRAVCTNIALQRRLERAHWGTVVTETTRPGAPRALPRPTVTPPKRSRLN